MCKPPLPPGWEAGTKRDMERQRVFRPGYNWETVAEFLDAVSGDFGDASEHKNEARKGQRLQKLYAKKDRLIK